MTIIDVRAFEDERSSQPVRGFLHSPASPKGDGLVLTHGAGGNCGSPLLVALADAFAGSGMSVLRFDLPFRQKRPHGAPSNPAQDQDGIRAAIAAMKKMASRVFAGGQSYGGRQTTMVAAEEPGLVNGLLLLSYPLHPPSQPSQLRTAHFPRLQTPAMFVQGSRDPFGSVDEIRAALQLIPSRTKLHVVEGGTHGLAGKRTDVGALAAEIASVFLSFV